MANDKDLTRVEQVVFLCQGGGCQRRGAEAITAAIRALITARGYGDRIHTIKTRCVNPCEHGPVVIVYPAGVWYGSVTEDRVAELVERQLIRGVPLAALQIHPLPVDPDGDAGGAEARAYDA
ncbi:MAG: (2Fe-2S) ferredoxin domain-containing protein [candidate division NC10 bacterium]|nr:(2Fe-2S) ferredoxin domain-containing protein [candidate division NC10 bacterium]